MDGDIESLAGKRCRRSWLTAFAKMSWKKRGIGWIGDWSPPLWAVKPVMLCVNCPGRVIVPNEFYDKNRTEKSCRMQPGHSVEPIPIRKGMSSLLPGTW